MMPAPVEHMTMLRFHGGPWNGFVIEYAERVQPDDALDPAGGALQDRGRYLLNDRGGAYIWSGTTARCRTP
jgi:hypothetical protein